jgi:hypothetical protein
MNNVYMLTRKALKNVVSVSDRRFESIKIIYFFFLKTKFIIK